MTRWRRTKIAAEGASVGVGVLGGEMSAAEAGRRCGVSPSQVLQ
jgi:hypothetical protein